MKLSKVVTGVLAFLVSGMALASGVSLDVVGPHCQVVQANKRTTAACSTADAQPSARFENSELQLGVAPSTGGGSVSVGYKLDSALTLGLRGANTSNPAGSSANYGLFAQLNADNAEAVVGADQSHAHGLSDSSSASAGLKLFLSGGSSWRLFVGADTSYIDTKDQNDPTYTGSASLGVRAKF